MADRSLTQWGEVFEQLYAEKDQARSPVDLWTAAYAHFSHMGEAIRKVHFEELLGAATHAFCWLCSFVLGCRRRERSVFWLQEGLAGVVAMKYPLCCGHCGHQPCNCNPLDMDAHHDKAADYRARLEDRLRLEGAWQAWSIEQWKATFAKVYGQQIHQMSLETVGFHFLEEAGEAAKAIRSLQQLSEVSDNDLACEPAKLFGELSTAEGIVELHEKHKTVDTQHRMGESQPEVIMARLVQAKMEMVVEVADTFSWFCSVLNKVYAIAKNCMSDQNGGSCNIAHRGFEERLAAEYLRDGHPICKACGTNPCACVFRMAAPQA